MTRKHTRRKPIPGWAELNAAIWAGVREGLNDPEIGERIGRDSKAISRHRYKYNIPHGSKFVQPDMVELAHIIETEKCVRKLHHAERHAFIKLAAETHHWSDRKIGQVLNIGWHAIGEQRRKLGVRSGWMLAENIRPFIDSRGKYYW